MASPILLNDMVYAKSVSSVTESHSPAITQSRPLPAENPSHSRVNSKDTVSSKTAVTPTQPTQPKAPIVRGKSNSLSFPLLVSAAASSQSASAPRRKSLRTRNALRIHVPQSSDTSFLTTLAAQERHVLELKEELSKAEESLHKLKSQWASHESRRRETEARRLHRMKSIKSDGPATPKFGASTGGTTTPREVYEEIQRRKATEEQAKRSPRQRRFSGSRQIRALSLVSSDVLAKYAEHAQSQSQLRREVAGENQEKVQSPVLMSSPSDVVPPTPDLIHEDDDESPDPSTDSQQSIESPKHPRHGVRASMQMAADFREGLWTFFEDLKQATYGEDARGANVQVRGGSKYDAQIRREMQARGTHAQAKPHKRTVRRQTWQIRPRDSQESLIDAGGVQHTVQNRRDGLRLERPTLSHRTNTAPVETPQKTPQFYEKEVDGEVWQSWGSPRTGTDSRTTSRATTPVQPTRNPSIDHQTKKLVGEEGVKRGSLPWPALSKLKPGQLTRTASQLMDEWEKSLNPPTAYHQIQHIQQQHDSGRISPRPASPRPVSKRSNSRLDETYT